MRRPSRLHMHIGESMRAARANAGMSTRRAASHAHVSVAKIRAMEHGHVNDTPLDVATAMADAYGCNVDTLCGYVADFK